MKLANEFTIDAPVDSVWTSMLDLERVAACVPGSTVVGPSPDGGLEANIRVKLGPMTMNYRGVVLIVAQDHQNRTATMQAKAREVRGQGSATAEMVMEVRDRQPVEVSIATDLDVTGRVAQMGRGVMQDVAGRIVEDFAKGLQTMLADQPAHSKRTEDELDGKAENSPSGDKPGDESSLSRLRESGSSPVASASTPAPATETAPPVQTTATLKPSRVVPIEEPPTAAEGPSISALALLGAVVRGRLRLLFAWIQRRFGASR